MRRNRLFGLDPGTLPGHPIRDYLPSLINVPALDSNQQAFRTAMQCRGHKADGEVFQADVWFSTYVTSAGPRLAAMVLDTSEDLRTHEESSFHQMLAKLAHHGGGCLPRSAQCMRGHRVGPRETWRAAES